MGAPEHRCCDQLEVDGRDIADFESIGSCFMTEYQVNRSFLILPLSERALARHGPGSLGGFPTYINVLKKITKRAWPPPTGGIN